jgi:hypothetical protein
MFVKWECGCIGIETEEPEGARILKACDEGIDAPAGSLSWFRRDQSGKSCTPLSAEQIADLHLQIARRFALADRFEDVRRALGIEG